MSIKVGIDSKKVRKEILVNGKKFAYYSIDAASQAGLGDFSKLPAALNVVLKTRDFPNDTPTTKVTSSITNTTKKIDTRARARQAIYRIESDDDNDISVRNGLKFRLGATRFNFREDGRR